MPLYCKKPIPVACHQWHTNGDHPEDYSKEHVNPANMLPISPDFRRTMNWEGDVVRYFRRPDIAGEQECKYCRRTMHDHGWIDTLEGGHIVCPGDWIITGVRGERYPCKPDIFAETYELAK